jgi:hypothetical protein
MGDWKAGNHHVSEGFFANAKGNPPGYPIGLSGRYPEGGTNFPEAKREIVEAWKAHAAGPQSADRDSNASIVDRAAGLGSPA